MATDYAKWDKLTLSDEDEDEDDKRQQEQQHPQQQQQQQPSTPEILLENLTQAEALGEEVLVERSQMVELDRRRNLNREALAALRQSAKTQGAEVAGAQKRWVCLGDVFVRHSSSDAKAMLESDQARIEQEMEALRTSVKRKTSKLCEIDPSIAQGSNVHRTFRDLVGVSAGELEGMISAGT